MFTVRILATCICVRVAPCPAFAQEPVPDAQHRRCRRRCTGRFRRCTDRRRQRVRRSATAARIAGPANAISSSSPASDFKNFFSADTARTLAYTSIVAIASAPWDREGVNNGFNIPTTVFQSGNVIGSFAFQVAAGFATYGVAKIVHNQKAAEVGRDIVRAQILSQVMVQTLKFTVQRERPDGSNRKSFPSGHSASAFATATVLHRHYGWKSRRPGVCARQLRRAGAHVVEPPSCHRRRYGCRLRHRVGTHRDDDGGEAQVQRRRAAASRRRVGQLHARSYK